MHVQRVESDEALREVFPLVGQLRQALRPGDFVPLVRRMQEQGYTLVALYDPAVRAVAGFRQLELLATGPILLVEDLVTDATHRSRGYGKHLLDWLVAEAARRGCGFIELLSRPEAEAFYRRCGMELVPGPYLSLRIPR